MSTIDITRVEDVREGDRVTMTRNGTAVSGAVRDVTHGDYTHIDIATLPCVMIVGDGSWTVVSATREVQDLPVEPGSVIVNSTVRGVEGETAILDPEVDWFTTVCVAFYCYHAPEDITA